MYSGFLSVGHNNFGFIEVNKHFWNIEAMNYFVAYINYRMTR